MVYGNSSNLQNFGLNSMTVQGKNLQLSIAERSHQKIKEEIKYISGEIDVSLDNEKIENISAIQILGNPPAIVVILDSKNTIHIFRIESKIIYHQKEISLKCLRKIKPTVNVETSLKSKITQKYVIIMRFLSTGMGRKTSELLLIGRSVEKDTYEYYTLPGQIVDSDFEAVENHIWILSSIKMEGDTPAKLSYMHLIIEDNNGIVEDYRYEEYAKDLGVFYFEPGPVFFHDSSRRLFYALNLHAEDEGVLVIDFAKIKHEIVIDNYLRLPRINGGPLQVTSVCLTINSLVILYRAENRPSAITINMDVSEFSWITIPLKNSEDAHQDSTLERLLCPSSGSFFSLSSKERFSEQRHILNYFPFDGTLSTRKLHSVMGLGDSGAISVSELFDTDDQNVLAIYTQNKLLKAKIASMKGPSISLSTNGVPSGEHYIIVKGFNEKFSDRKNLSFSVLPKSQITYKLQETIKLPDKLEDNQILLLSDYVNIEGGIISATILDNPYIELLPRISSIKSTLYPQPSGSRFASSDANNVVFLNEKNDCVWVYDKSARLRLEISLSQFGIGCSRFELTEDYRELFLFFVCERDEKETLNIISLEKLEISYKVIFSQELEIYIEKTKIILHKKQLYILVRLKNSLKMIIYRIDTKGYQFKKIEFDLRTIGESKHFMNLIFEFQILNSIPLIISTIPGLNKVFLHSLNFDKQDSNWLMQSFNIPGNIPIYKLSSYIDTYSDELDIVLLRLDNQLIRFAFKINEKQRRIILNANSLMYRFPKSVNCFIERLYAGYDYFYLKGDFILTKGTSETVLKYNTIIFNKSKQDLFAVIPTTELKIERLVMSLKGDSLVLYYKEQNGIVKSETLKITDYLIKVKNMDAINIQLTANVLLEGIEETKIIPIYLKRGGLETIPAWLVISIVFSLVFISVVGCTYWMSRQSLVKRGEVSETDRKEQEEELERISGLVLIPITSLPSPKKRKKSSSKPNRNAFKFEISIEPEDYIDDSFRMDSAHNSFDL